MDKKQLTDYLVKVILLFFAIIPLLYFNQIRGVPFKAFIFGTGSWGIGLIFKMFSHQLIVVRLKNKNLPGVLYSAVNGLLSGFFELFAAYLIITLTKEKFAFDFNAIISFGLAIGSLEIIIVVFSKDNNLLKGTALEKQSEELVEYVKNIQGVNYYIFNLFFPIIERVIATFLHISTRGLVFLTIITGSIFPAFIALIVFIFADGLLVFNYYLTDKLSSEIGIVKLFIYLAVLTSLSTIIFIVLSQPYKNFVL
ncbi:MAG: hypothetical protein GXO50_10055 [Chlorobi bacterium]|nr:hypothetical protein [Chlorobiota bacterium]